MKPPPPRATIIHNLSSGQKPGNCLASGPFSRPVRRYYPITGTKQASKENVYYSPQRTAALTSHWAGQRCWWIHRLTFTPRGAAGQGQDQDHGTAGQGLCKLTSPWVTFLLLLFWCVLGFCLFVCCKTLIPNRSSARCEGAGQGRLGELWFLRLDSGL